MNNPAAEKAVDPQRITIESEIEVDVPDRTGYFGTLLRA
jgi:hypothetical protein